MSEASSKKVIVIGDGAVGKTCFVSKVTENKFIPNYLPTLGGKERLWRVCYGGTWLGHRSIASGYGGCKIYGLGKPAVLLVV